MEPRRGWLLGMMLAAVVAGEAAESGKRVMAAVSRVDKPAAAAVSSGGGRINFTQLTSGVSAPFSLPAVGQPTLFVGDAGYRITVPSGATRVTVSLVTTTPNVDVDLYVRLGQDPGVSGGTVIADYRSEGLTGNETITITGAPSVPPGTYHIGLLLFDTGVAASGTVTATVETGGGGPPTTGGGQLTSGVSSPFSFPAVTMPTLFFGANSFRIDVPSGATQLVVQVITSTPGVDVDLFVRFGQDTAVSGGAVVADYRSEGLTGNETLTITGGSSPPLQAGTYFISLAVFTTGTPASGTVMATVTGGGGGGGGGNADLTGTWNWSANCSGSMFGGQFRINTQQASGAFAGEFLNTNSGDSGTINDGNINGTQVGFRRTIPGGAVQLWSGTLGSSITGLRVDGTISQGGSQICTFSANRTGGGGGGGGGGAGGTVDKIYLRGGSFSAGAFNSNGRIWDTDPATGSWVLGVTSQGAGNPLLNAANKSVNIPVPPNNYWIYNDPTSGGYQGAAVQVTVHWTDGRPDDVAAFTVGDFSSTAPWTRLLGTSNLLLSGTGMVNLDRVGTGGSLTANGVLDNVLQLTIGGSGGSGLLTNPSFELPGGTTSFFSVSQGQTTIPGWSVTRGSVDVVSTQFYNCAHENFCIDLDGSSFGGISQTFATTPGAAYTVTFEMAGNFGGAPVVKQMRVMAAGQSQDFSFDTTGRSATNMGWTTRTFAFTASGSSTTLEFQTTHTSGGFAGAMLDNVRVTAGSGGGGGGGGGGGSGVLGTNLIKNPGADGGTIPVGVGCPTSPIPDWTSDGLAVICLYAGNGFFVADSPLPPDHGPNFFAAGAGTTPVRRLTQTTADLSPAASQIDANGVTYRLDGWLGGYGGRSDNAQLKITFRGSGGNTLGTDVIGPVTPDDRNGRAGFFQRTKNGTVPAQTRNIFLELIFTPVSGGNDAYADNLSLVLTAGSGGGGGGGGGAGSVGTNLIQNPGAEAGPADPGCNGVPSIPAWTTAGVTGVCRYGTSGGWPLMTDPGPPDRGNNFFNGGNAATSSISQTIDVSGLGSQIDGGGLTFVLSGYLGGFASDDDNARLRAVFQNASGGTLRTDTIGPVLAAERGNQTKLLLKSTTGPVPAGTRRVVVTLEFTRASGSADDGYADSLSLVLNSGGGGGGGGGGSTPILSVSPNLDFGSVTVGQQRDLSLTIRNTGTATLNVTGLTSSNPSEFSVVGATSFTVAPAGQQDVTLRFRPSATGSRSSNLTVATNDPSRPSTSISLTGTGASAGPVIVSSTTTLNFTTSPGSNPAPQTFTLRNTSSALNYLIMSTQPWLSTNPSSGALQNGQTTTVTASVNVAGLAAGNYSADLRVVLPVGAAPPQAVQQAAPQVIITVRLVIQAGGGGGGSCPPGPSATPVITAGAIVNAASFVSSALPAGAIARGAIFSMFLQNGGPTALQVASSFPLQTTLGCVSVRVTQGSTSVDAIPLAAITSQVNAIMPSNAPLGDATITVTFNGRTSSAQRVRIVESSFGFFTANQSGMGPAIVQNFESQTSVPLNSPRRPILRGRRGIAYGTGLGGIRGADNQPAAGGDPQVNVELTIGSKRAVVEYAGRTPGFAGLDQINFVVADDTPLGCYVPMTARIGGLITNSVTIAVSDNPSECSDPFNPFGSLVSRGGKLGSIQMIRLNARLQLDATTNFTNIDADLGTAVFSEFPAGGEFAYNPISSLPPLGSCTSASAGGIDLSGLLGGSLPGGSGATGRILNAGPALQVSGAGGNKVLPRDSDSGIYFNLIGGTVPIPGLPLPSSPLYLNPGDFTVTGPGGPDIGAFMARVRVPASFIWSNREAVTQSTRANGVSVSWSGGDPSSQGVTILGGNLDQDSGAGAIFVCFAPFGPGNFAVPASITQALPPSNLSDPSKTVGFLVVGVGPLGNVPTFTAPNLDQGLVFFLQFSATSVIWR